MDTGHWTIVSGKSFEGTLTVGFGGEYMEYRRERDMYGDLFQKFSAKKDNL